MAAIGATGGSEAKVDLMNIEWRFQEWLIVRDERSNVLKKEHNDAPGNKKQWHAFLTHTTNTLALLSFSNVPRAWEV